MALERLYDPRGTGPRILSIGTEQRLLWSRQMILESSGYRVTSALNGEPIAAESLASADLLLLCHSLDSQDCRALMKRVLGINPALCVMMLSQSASTGGVCRSGTVVCPSQPRKMLRQVDKLLKMPVRKAAVESRLAAAS